MSYREVKKHGLLFWKRSEVVTFDYPEGTFITGIACTDLDPNKKGLATIVSGGINLNYVQINLESERSVGLRYIIEIYAPSFEKYLYQKTTETVSEVDTDTNYVQL